MLASRPLKTPEERKAQLKEMEARAFDTFPLRYLEVMWIDATCLYELYDEPALSDGTWDRLTKYLLERREDLTPYFRESVPMACLEAFTGSGIDWTKGVPALAAAALDPNAPKPRRPRKPKANAVAVAVVRQPDLFAL